MENLKAETRAGVLVEALPYLQEYNGKIVVVKYGGNAMINEDLKQAVIRDIVLLNLVGVKVVLVHGGGPEIGELLKKTGKESKFIEKLRVIVHADLLGSHDDLQGVRLRVLIGSEGNLLRVWIHI